MNVAELKPRFDRRTRIDLAVAELHEVFILPPRVSPACEFDLRGPRGPCPQRRTASEQVDPDKVYGDLVASISFALGITGWLIQRVSLLIRDLSLS